MLTWPSLDDWCDQVAFQLSAALKVQGVKASALHRDLLARGVSVRDSEGSFQNALTPTTKSHHLRLDEFWNVLNLIDSTRVIHSICRQLSVLVAPEPVSSGSSQAALLGAFADRNGELAETQHLLVSVIGTLQSVTFNRSQLDKDREGLLREIYEDFCSSLSLLFKLEQVCVEKQALANDGSGLQSPDLYEHLEQQISEALEELRNQEDTQSGLSNRVLWAASKPDEPLQLSLPSFLKLMFTDKSRNVAKAFVESLGYRLSPLPALDWRVSGNHIIHSYAELELKQADTAEKISSVLMDQQITQSELSEIYQELVDEHQAQVSLVMNSGVLPHHLAQTEA